MREVGPASNASPFNSSAFESDRLTMEDRQSSVPPPRPSLMLRETTSFTEEKMEQCKPGTRPPRPELPSDRRSIAAEYLICRTEDSKTTRVNRSVPGQAKYRLRNL